MMAFQISKSTTYINVGIWENEELCFIRFDFIYGSHEWGFIAHYPDGNTNLCFEAPEKKQMGAVLEYGGSEYCMDIFLNDDANILEIMID